MSDVANVEMAAAWDGAQGDQWVEREDQMNAALATHSTRLLAAAAVGASDHVLDIGCGTGATTRACAERAVDGHVLGVDLSTAMLARARTRAADAGLTNIEFARADAQVYPFEPAAYDLVVSQFGVMFFDDPVAAFTNVGRAVKPGGRLAAIVWQAMSRNEWVAVPRAALTLGRVVDPVADDVPGAFGLADPDRTRGILAASGFAEIHLDDVLVPYRFGADADAATDHARQIALVRGPLDGLDADDTARALDALHEAMAARESSEGVVLDSRIWVITAVR